MARVVAGDPPRREHRQRRASRRGVAGRGGDRARRPRHGRAALSDRRAAGRGARSMAGRARPLRRRRRRVLAVPACGRAPRSSRRRPPARPSRSCSTNGCVSGSSARSTGSRSSASSSASPRSGSAAAGSASSTTGPRVGRAGVTSGCACAAPWTASVREHRGASACVHPRSRRVHVPLRRRAPDRTGGARHRARARARELLGHVVRVRGRPQRAACASTRSTRSRPSSRSRRRSPPSRTCLLPRAEPPVEVERAAVAAVAAAVA